MKLSQARRGPWLTPTTDEAAADQFIAAANAFRMQKMGMSQDLKRKNRFLFMSNL
jgi:hypothetical protein